MENQHKLIKGYRDLSQEEIDLMNKIKTVAVTVGGLAEEISKYRNKEYMKHMNALTDQSTDSDHNKLDELMDLCCWTEEGKRDLQVGFMKLTRSVAAPTTF